eukprot:m.98743 g.98743  ORF g.98743 m.98743 type:complete len:464 (-) comp14018_c0_seq3:413-1804(-)
MRYQEKENGGKVSKERRNLANRECTSLSLGKRNANVRRGAQRRVVHVHKCIDGLVHSRKLNHRHASVGREAADVGDNSKGHERASNLLVRHGLGQAREMQIGRHGVDVRPVLRHGILEAVEGRVGVVLGEARLALLGTRKRHTAKLGHLDMQHATVQRDVVEVGDGLLRHGGLTKLDQRRALLSVGNLDAQDVAIDAKENKEVVTSGCVGHDVADEDDGGSGAGAHAGHEGLRAAGEGRGTTKAGAHGGAVGAGHGAAAVRAGHDGRAGCHGVAHAHGRAVRVLHAHGRAARHLRSAVGVHARPTRVRRGHGGGAAGATVGTGRTASRKRGVGVVPAPVVVVSHNQLLEGREGDLQHAAARVDVLVVQRRLCHGRSLRVRHLNQSAEATSLGIGDDLVHLAMARKEAVDGLQGDGVDEVGNLHVQHSRGLCRGSSSLRLHLELLMRRVLEACSVPTDREGGEV